MSPMLLTVGHGSLLARDVVALLTRNGVTALVDVRRHPGSRRHPQFRRAAMEEWLAAAGIDYAWEEDLGGRRPVPEGSPDVAVPDALRGYAAHLRSQAFDSALDRVLAMAASRASPSRTSTPASTSSPREHHQPRRDRSAYGPLRGRKLTPASMAASGTVAVCCAEADLRRCHRRLLADAVTLVRGGRVEHLQHDGSRQAHVPTPGARLDGPRLVYDGAEPRLPGLEA